jgi:arginyl-tRNA synthetase
MIYTIQNYIKNKYQLDYWPTFTRPEYQFGDFATNIAMILAKSKSINPRELALDLSNDLMSQFPTQLVSAEVAGPGFVNIKLSDQVISEMLSMSVAKTFEHQQILCEYSDPNPFKVLHAGHLYTSIVGDAIANMHQLAGANVVRLNFGGDVGLHVAKNMWAIVKYLGGVFPAKLDEIEPNSRAEFLSKRYVEGNAGYEQNEAIKAEIVEYNKAVYQLHFDNDHVSDFAKIYWTCRTWSYAYFDAFYGRVGTKFDRYIPESMTAPLGLQIVKQQLGLGVYELSDKAVIFAGSRYGLHDRVFINSAGLPTYEAKDVGLIFTKEELYHPDKSIIITANDITEYMKVVLKSVEQYAPEVANKTKHITHGVVKLAGGVKMSSRLGNFLKAEDILDLAKTEYDAVQATEQAKTVANTVVLAAVKYAFLKQGIGGDVIYDPKDSLSMVGNSGPYLLYSYARSCALLEKAEGAVSAMGSDFTELERKFALLLSDYPEIFQKALTSQSPMEICNYAYELAREFSRFYENNQIVDDPRQSHRLVLVIKFQTTLKSCLNILGIQEVQKM